jgi:hypothetical protein
MVGCSTAAGPPESSIRLHFTNGKRLPAWPDSLLPIFPNPFNRGAGDTSLTVVFNMKDSGSAIVLIQNALGDEIAGFSDSLIVPGFYTGQWNPIASDGTPLIAGIYFITFRTQKYIDSRLVNIQQNE